ncbi:MAG TPA: LysR family transcriptional regulator [Burkholderiales bacterium]|jgi:DNA-binding transcriptional LysR family regulator|nr:LysR family transcriptional regulator [Burkholderiales bacterium]
MNLQQLTYFVAVARARNFTRAAETCFVAQPALSQQIRKLEEELGLPVFERRRRGVNLTVAGTAFLAYAEQVLRLVAEGKQCVSDLQKVRHGVISVMCLPTVATYWLPRVISRYRRHYPDVEVQIHEHAGCTPEDFRGAIADVGIVQLGDAVAGRIGSGVQAERLFVDEQVLIFPADHRLAKAPAEQPLALKEVAGEAFVLPKPSCGMSRVIAQAFSESGVQPRVRLETSQVEAVCEMVAAGLGIGLMPTMAMQRTYPNLRWRRVRKPVPRRVIALAWSADRSLSPAAAAFMQIVREIAREEMQPSRAVRAVAGRRPALAVAG